MGSTQRSMQMTKQSLSRRLFVGLLAVIVLGVVAFLQFGHSLFGLTAPGSCTITGADSSAASTVSHAEAQEIFQKQRAAGTNVPRLWVSCSYVPATGSGDLVLNKRGLTKSAQRMDDAVRVEFGRLPDGGYQPGGVTSGHIPGSAHYEGRAIDYFFRPYTDPAQRIAGWQLAQWAVIHADDYDIATVIFDDMIWYRNTSMRGWQKYTHPSGRTDNPILRHLDHVHIDVR